jgi:FAD/FMN-containing dehydrogenase
MHAGSVLKNLRDVIPDERLVPSSGMPFRYRFDALRPYRPYPGLRKRGYLPLYIIRPESVEEVAEIVRVARRSHTAIVPYGAGTGLMGAALSVKRGLLVDTGLMDNIEVNEEDNYVEAQAGTVLENIYERMNEHNLFFAHDPWTRPIATLGGGIATNSLGYFGSKYGSLGNQLLGIEAVMPDGRILRTRPAQYSSTGFDLKRLFIGTEGQFGLVTSATVRAFPKPEHFELASYRFDDFERGFRAICSMRQKGVRQSMLDYGEPDPHNSGKPELHLAFDGLTGEVEANIRETDEIIRSIGGVRLRDDAAQQFWEHRHDIALTYWKRIHKITYQVEPRTKYDYIHVSLPSSRILQFRAEVLRITKSGGVDLLEVGLWHGPELFSMVTSSTHSKPKVAAKKLWDSSNKIIEFAQELGGCME